MEDVKRFYDDVLKEINLRDGLHYKTLIQDTPAIGQYSPFYNYLSSLIYCNFQLLKIPVHKIVSDYLRMVNDMRRETAFFNQFGEYSCKSEKDAYEKFYSKGETMNYYINALMISQVLWIHHYKTLEYFDKNIKSYFGKNDKISVLDVGAGHGLYSSIIADTFVNYQKIDVFDISEASLSITEKLLGNDRIEYHKTKPIRKYDVIIMGEVIEHMDYPASALIGMAEMLTDEGVMWVSTPTNAPAIDHIHLFKSVNEVYDLLHECDLNEIEACVNRVNGTLTELVGVFCTKAW